MPVIDGALIAGMVAQAGSFLNCSSSAESCHEIDFRLQSILIYDSFESFSQKDIKALAIKSGKHGGQITELLPSIHLCWYNLFKYLGTVCPK
ncbi:hypothetical protein CEXT_686131 [Caerostris extrusa]|uniref:Uncharacterized protein n=1 Tax=Caerostris extrusa TaxID=172846 RepID=A0AAV4MSJ3_CAEEX|nr:hypothetical protein CEXT_686131 [Caerostris extrusa]